jgi:hypothetical protein
MDYENAHVVQPVTRSSLSDWAGVMIDKDRTVMEGVRIGDDKVVADHLDISNRLFNMLESGGEYFSISPSGNGKPDLLSLWDMMKLNPVLSKLLQLYAGVTYDSVTFRFSLSNPKGLVGAVVVGGFPFVNWLGDQLSFADSQLGFGENLMTRQWLMSSPESHLLTMGEAKDVEFTMPWQSNFPYWSTVQVYLHENNGPDENLLPGVPCVYCLPIGLSYISSVVKPAELRVFVKFNGLRWLGPADGAFGAVFERQSGLEGLAATALVTAASSVAAAGSEILTEAVEGVASFVGGNTHEGGYDKPTTVQFSFAGDTSVYGAPSTCPIFTDWQSTAGERHKVIDVLKHPQFVTFLNTSSLTTDFYANPTAPRGSNDINGVTQFCSWLRFLSKMNTFWRGTLKYNFVICGHPMVEVYYRLQIIYSDNAAYNIPPSGSSSANSVLEGICNGVHNIEVPMPSLSPFDHFPICDSKDLSTEDIFVRSPSAVRVEFKVISTMLDVDPVVPVLVFLSAGDDFEFLQPRPVGLFGVENATFERQVQLGNVSQVFQTRAKSQKSLEMMVSLVHLEDYLEIWSRALPYARYDADDEPTATIERAMDPYWWPMESASAASTPNVNNSWYVTNDFISFVSSCFLFYKGSIALKIVVDTSRFESPGFVYCALASRKFLRQPVNNPYTFSPTHFPPESNFGVGSVVTYAPSQPVLEVTLPQRGICEWGLTNPQQLVTTGYGTRLDPFNGGLDSNVLLQEPNGDLRDALFRKVGPDFVLAVRTLLPSPFLWVASGYDWS